MLDISQRPAYLLALIQRWLLFVLNMFVLGLAVLAVTLVTQLRGINTGFTGSGLLTLMQLGTFLATDVQCYAKLETSIGAVSRLKAFTEDTVSHSMDAGDVAELPSSWPSRGSVEVNGVSASYETYVCPLEYSNIDQSLTEVIMLVAFNPVVMATVLAVLC